MLIKFVDEEATNIKSKPITVKYVLSNFPIISVGFVNILSIASIFLLKIMSEPKTIKKAKRENINKFNNKLWLPLFNSFFYNINARKL